MAGKAFRSWSVSTRCLRLDTFEPTPFGNTDSRTRATRIVLPSARHCRKTSRSKLGLSDCQKSQEGGYPSSSKFQFRFLQPTYERRHIYSSVARSYRRRSFTRVSMWALSRPISTTSTSGTCGNMVRRHSHPTNGRRNGCDAYASLNPSKVA